MAGVTVGSGESTPLVRMLDEAIETADPGDLDRVMDVLRNFRHQQVLRVAACDLTCTAPIAGTLGESGGLVKVVLLSRPERLPAGNLPLGLRSQPDLFPPIALI